MPLSKNPPHRHRLVVLTLLTAACASTADPLPSWRDGDAKRSIVDFVERVTTEGGADFVPEAERVATFDNDGTLWSEQPLYFQLLFAIDRVEDLAAQHPDWNTKQPFQAVLARDQEAIAAQGTEGLLELVMATHAGMTSVEFQENVRDWLREARHPTHDRPYTDLVYQPMLELLRYLEAEGFDVYITSGGGIEFMRAWVEDVYGIPPERVIGSSIETKLEMRGGEPTLVRLPAIDFLDDKAGKPVAIDRFIGRRPIAAFGNSDGDREMLQWVVAGEGPRFALLVHHTDARREWAYDRDSHIGRLDEALDEARDRGWTVVDMAEDWEVVYPFELD